MVPFVNTHGGVLLLVKTFPFRSEWGFQWSLKDMISLRFVFNKNHKGPSIKYVRVRIRGLETLVFQKILRTYLMVHP